MKIKMNINVTINGSVNVNWKKESKFISPNSGETVYPSSSSELGDISFDNMSVGINIDEDIDVSFKEYVGGIVDVLKSTISNHVSKSKVSEEEHKKSSDEMKKEQDDFDKKFKESKEKIDMAKAQMCETKPIDNDDYM